MSMITWRLDWTALARFKAAWPCHGLPPELDSIVFEFEGNGDLVDVHAYDACGVEMDMDEFDGPHMVAMADDAWRAAYWAKP